MNQATETQIASPLVLRGKHSPKPRPWRQASDAMGDSAKQTLKRLSSQETTRDVVKDVIGKLKSDAINSNSRWELKVGNRKFEFGEYAQKVVRALQAFLSVSDTLVQYDPTHLASPWPGIRLIAMACISRHEEYRGLLLIVEKLVLILHRGRIIEELYLNNTCKSDAAQDGLRTSLVKLYTVLLETLARCLRHQERNGTVRTIVNVLSPQRTSNLLNDLEDAEIRALRDVDFCRSQLRNDLDEGIRVRLLKLEECLDQCRTSLAVVNEMSERTLERVEDGEWKEILDFISEVKFGNVHESIRQLRTEGTCDWLLKHAKFKAWEDSTTSEILWVKGSPGTGKTVLASRAVDHILLKQAHHRRNDRNFAYFYCCHREFIWSSANSIIRCIFRQLASTLKQDEPEIHETLRILYRDCHVRGRDPTFEICKSKIADVVRTYNTTTIVIDGLNECDQQSRGLLLDLFQELVQGSKGAVKILLVSRPTQDISNALESCECMEINEDMVHEDIKKFVRETVQRDVFWGRKSGIDEIDETKEAIRKEIVAALTPKSKHAGSFLWAELHLRQLDGVVLPSVARQRLKTLPDGPTDTYVRIYSKIKRKDEDEQTIAIRILQWTMCAATPPTTAELRYAIRDDPAKSGDFPDQDITEEIVTSLTAGLLEQDKLSGTWGFSHFSVVEYLQSHDPSVYDPHEIHKRAARFCLHALLRSLQIDDPIGQESADGAFANYAKWCWHTHLRHLTAKEPLSDELRSLITVFFGEAKESSVEYQCWAAEMLETCPPQRFRAVALRRPSARHLVPTNSAVFGVCTLGISVLLSDWIKNREIDPDLCNYEDWCLLSIAVFHGQSNVWKLLLHYGVEINRIDGSYYGGPLATAAATSASATDDLLSAGGDPNLELPSGFGTPLGSAALEPCIDSLEVLLQRGADPNRAIRIPHIPGSALAIAAWRGHVKAVETLISFAADVNLPIRGCYGVRQRYGNALAAAAAAGAGHLEAVMALHEAGADINMCLDATFGSPLAAAAGAYRSNPKVVKYLLDNDANVNEPLLGLYGSALVAASWAPKGNAEDFQEELKEAEAELGEDPDRFAEFAATITAKIDARGLHDLKRGDARIVRILLDHGARVRMPLEGKFENATNAALAGENKEVIEMVRERLDVEMMEAGLWDMDMRL